MDSDQRLTEASVKALEEFHRHWELTDIFINSGKDGSQGRAAFSPRKEPLQNTKIPGPEEYDQDAQGAVFKPDPKENFVFFEINGEDSIDVNSVEISGVHSITA